jgi:hypothetical protein
MKRYNKQMLMLYLFSILAIIYFFTPTISWSDVYKNSPVSDARTTASILDLKLLKISLIWNQIYVINPPPDIRKEYPLITKVQVGTELNHYGDERIRMTGWIHNLQAFLSLSPKNRKKLLKEVLSTLMKHLEGSFIYLDHNPPADSLIRKPELSISLVINDFSSDDKGNGIRNILPYDLFGQAAYHNREFIFSENYYLHLKVKDGVAQSIKQILTLCNCL